MRVQDGLGDLRAALEGSGGGHPVGIARVDVAARGEDAGSVAEEVVSLRKTDRLHTFEKMAKITTGGASPSGRQNGAP